MKHFISYCFLRFNCTLFLFFQKVCTVIFVYLHFDSINNFVIKRKTNLLLVFLSWYYMSKSNFPPPIEKCETEQAAVWTLLWRASRCASAIPSTVVACRLWSSCCPYEIYCNLPLPATPQMSYYSGQQFIVLTHHYVVTQNDSHRTWT